MRILAVDFGEARIGLALSDPAGIIASPFTTLHTKDKGEQTRRVAEIAQAEGAERILVGIPYRLDGSVGEMAETAERFARKLESQCGLPVVRWDERLTSFAADQELRQMGRVGKRRKQGDLDSMAACLMLREYLDRLDRDPEPWPAARGASDGGER